MDALCTVAPEDAEMPITSPSATFGSTTRAFGTSKCCNWESWAADRKLWEPLEDDFMEFMRASSRGTRENGEEQI